LARPEIDGLSASGELDEEDERNKAHETAEDASEQPEVRPSQSKQAVPACSCVPGGRGAILMRQCV
jgi:hypothetical protein